MLVIKNVLTPEECSSIIKEYERRRITAGIETSKNVDHKQVETSNYTVVTLPLTSPVYNLIIDKMSLGLQAWVDHLRSFGCFHTDVLVKNLKHPHAVRIMKYQQGQFIHPHTDWSPFVYASITLNLNRDYKGGRFLFMKGLFEAELDQGDVLVFPADPFWVHEVTAITEGVRYSVNSFVMDREPSQVSADAGEIYKGIFKCL
jgi:predicted 2-oxoglutarate/Fe(II)-dependent dioxygenase YbiX